MNNQNNIQISNLKNRWTKIGKNPDDLKFKLFDKDTELKLIKVNTSTPCSPPIEERLYENSITRKIIEVHCEWDWLSNVASVRLWNK